MKIRFAHPISFFSFSYHLVSFLLVSPFSKIVWCRTFRTSTQKTNTWERRDFRLLFLHLRSSFPLHVVYFLFHPFLMVVTFYLNFTGERKKEVCVSLTLGRKIRFLPHEMTCYFPLPCLCFRFSNFSPLRSVPQLELFFCSSVSSSKNFHSNEDFFPFTFTYSSSSFTQLSFPFQFHPLPLISCFILSHRFFLEWYATFSLFHFELNCSLLLYFFLAKMEQKRYYSPLSNFVPHKK